MGSARCWDTGFTRDCASYGKEPQQQVKRPVWIALGVVALVVVVVGFGDVAGMAERSASAGRAEAGVGNSTDHRCVDHPDPDRHLDLRLAPDLARHPRWLDRLISASVPRAGAIVVTAFIVFFVGRWFFAAWPSTGSHGWADDRSAASTTGPTTAPCSPPPTRSQGGPARCRSGKIWAVRDATSSPRLRPPRISRRSSVQGPPSKIPSGCTSVWSRPTVPRSSPDLAVRELDRTARSIGRFSW